jgi:5'-nucleotidase
MRILLTNDDGIRAPGIRALAEVARRFGEVKVFAPDRERSACSHSMTMREPLRVWAVEFDGIEAFEVTGCPVDCVNIGLKLGFAGGCDLVLSGINDGPNVGVDVTYSGTVGGAMEGAICSIRSIAISMATIVEGAPPHFETGARWLEENWHMLMGAQLPIRTFLNVNIPAIAWEQIQGHRWVAMGGKVYSDRIEERSDPRGRPYYWQGGVAALNVEQPETDVAAISNGYVAITPIRTDWTDHAALASFQDGATSAVK